MDLQLRQARLSSGALGWQRGSTESALMSESIMRQLSVGELGCRISDAEPVRTSGDAGCVLNSLLLSIPIKLGEGAMAGDVDDASLWTLTVLVRLVFDAFGLLPSLSVTAAGDTVGCD